MKILFVLIALFSFSHVNAQFSSKVNWVTMLPKNETEKIPYNPARKLTWNDFKGKVSPANPNELAMTASGFGFTYTASADESSMDVSVSIYCYLSKKDSWVKPEGRNDYVLNHEQRHFDLTYIFAKRFAEKLSTSSFNRTNFEAGYDRLYAQYSKQLNDAQVRYDAETTHGINKQEQEAWNKQIDMWLKEVSSKN